MIETKRCPLIRTRWDMDYCEETERPSGRIRPCLLVTGDKCETWEEIKKEWEQEE